MSANLFGMFFLETPTKSSSRLPRRAVGAERFTDLSRDTALDGAESKDPEDAYLAYAVRSFSTTEARVQDLAAVPTSWSRVHLFMRCNDLPSPGLCKVFELGFDSANEVELLFAPKAFAEHGKMLAGSFCSRPGERPWRVRQMRASVVEKLRTA